MRKKPKDHSLHIVTCLAIADPKTVAQNFVYEMYHGQTETIKAFSQLLEFNRNEAGQNITAIVATATLPVNRQTNYLFNECDLIRDVCQYLSSDQIDQLQEHNIQNLANPEPNDEISLSREVFGAPDIIQLNEGNSFFAHFLREGRQFASETSLQIPDTKPIIKPVKGAHMGLLMLSMCLKKGFLPLMRHDGSHIISGFSTTVKGEIYNQTYDLAVNSLAQYGVVPTMQEQRLNRRVIYSFFGLPAKLQELQRDPDDFVADALEIWREFLLENPEYADKWGLSGFLDSEMRMIKPDGTPIISAQTGKQQIPVIDYTDLAVLRHLEKKLESILTDAEVYGSMPYDKLYRHMLESLELLSIEHILRDGGKPVLVNDMYDACATNKGVRFGEFKKAPELISLSSDKPYQTYEEEDFHMRLKRSLSNDNDQWYGYFIDVGQDHDRRMWVSEKAPCIHVLYPESITIHRVTLPREAVLNADKCMTFSGGSAYLVDCAEMKIDSTLAVRNEKSIPQIGNDADRTTSPKSNTNNPTEYEMHLI